MLLPVIEKIGDGIENEEVRGRFTEILRSGDINQIFSFLGEQRDILDLTFSKELLPALRFVLSQMFEKQFQKREYPNKDAFASFIKFSDLFLSFTPLTIEFYGQMARRWRRLDRTYADVFSLEKVFVLRSALDELFKKYAEHFSLLERADRKIVDKLKKYYFKSTSGGGYYYENWEDKLERWSFILNKNRMKKFDESHIVSLIRRAALELFQSHDSSVDLSKLIQKSIDLQFISELENSEILQRLIQDSQIEFVSKRGYW
ncbi:MAG: hypothetical protein A2017_16925 [Lentisphaerae bacterium GWF2_44_16]|nr:MAG: hypothetical protein A2017_16925 [Lentisphaerae bacterium GWF2_44_16]HAU66615.1 hypothetical protein [Candidatus Uhrbacteria bacterium]